MRRALHWLCSAIVVILGVSPTRADSAQRELGSTITATAHELEKRLIAPCCWRETLDVHQSQLASQLRQEIRTRITKGESLAAIEAALVHRHGPGLRAALPDNLGYFLFGFAGLFGIIVLRFILLKDPGFERAREPESLHPPSDRRLLSVERQRLENRLDEDLEEERLGA